MCAARLHGADVRRCARVRVCGSMGEGRPKVREVRRKRGKEVYCAFTMLLMFAEAPDDFFAKSWG